MEVEQCMGDLIFCNVFCVIFNSMPDCVIKKECKSVAYTVKCF